MRTRTLTLAACGLVALCAGCGGGTSTPATGSTPAPTTPPKANRNAERGEVVAIKGDVVTLTDKNGLDTSFDLTPTTVVNQEQDALISDATVGSCAFGVGERTAPDLVAARQVVLGAHSPAGDCRRGSGGDLHHLGVAGGEITAIDGTTYTVNSNAGPQRFQVNPQTKAVRLVKVATSSLAPGQCATARGPRDAQGVVTASSVIITPASVGGCFASGNGLGGTGGG